MAYTTEISDDAAAELTRLNLADSLERVLRMGDDDERGRALIASLILVHEYYSTVEQHAQLMEELKDDIMEFNDALVEQEQRRPVVDVVDHSDGSATVTVDVDAVTANRLASKGIEYTILQEMLGHPSLGDILRWVERGKQEEKTDDIMERFNEARSMKEDDRGD